MELVYLWVENYKNIQKQGFNFSPRFDCKYENNELTIIEKKEDKYIKDFFGENINVTAIVGKNGSGKSSVLECIKLAIKFYLEGCLSDDISLEYENFEKPYILIFKEEKIFYNISIHTPKEIDKTFRKNHIDNRKNFIFDSQNIYTVKKNPFPIELILNSSLFSTKISNFFNPDRVVLNLVSWSNQETAISDSIKEQLLYVVNDLSSKYENELKSLDIIQKYINQNNLNEFEELEHMFYIFNFSKELNKDFQNFLLALNKFNLIDIFDSTKKELYNKTGDLFSFGMSYSRLSNGEKHLFLILLSIKNFIYNKKEHEDIIIFLDEPDNELHPEWQRTIISELISTCMSNPKIHLILTSHSPFLLSDIPKQNIIFLDKDENGNCKVVDGLKEKKQTFGANIHTLLSDSFFMEDGLMGEFAKGKIDKAIKLLNQDNLDEKDLKYCEQIISIIGEPIVKNQLQRMLDSKRLKKVDEIDAIKQSMIAMQKRLDELENDKNK